MTDITRRNARFRTVISLIQHDADNPGSYHETLFEGIVEGKIATEKRGTAGFGYDPVFIPEATTRALPNLVRKSKTRSAIEQGLWRSWRKVSSPIPLQRKEGESKGDESYQTL